MIFHVLGLPHTQATEAFSACAFTNKVRFFCRMMKSRGHTVYLYAGETTDAPCDELITCVSEQARQRLVGDRHYTQASFDSDDEIWRIFNRQCISGIRQRAKPQDFICIMSGYAAKPVADAFPEMISCEYGIGHGGSFTHYRVFESYAWMHATYGAESRGSANNINPPWFDAVVPGYIDVAQFPYVPINSKDDYFLFVGRLIERKGPHIAAEVCQTAGKRLILAGPGEWAGYGEHVGEVGPQQRGELMSRAKALIMPTTYVEPFGNVAVEAQACGTPAICTDWGAMTETVEHNKTGFRCRTFDEFLTALSAVESLSGQYIRQRVIDNYSLEATAPKYELYFSRLLSLWDRGWYQTRG